MRADIHRVIRHLFPSLPVRKHGSLPFSTVNAALLQLETRLYALAVKPVLLA